jgi:hypothetical protein
MPTTKGSKTAKPEPTPEELTTLDNLDLEPAERDYILSTYRESRLTFAETVRLVGIRRSLGLREQGATRRRCFVFACNVTDDQLGELTRAMAEAKIHGKARFIPNIEVDAQILDGGVKAAEIAIRRGKTWDSA